MSLLLDALKKAEEAKLQASEEHAAQKANVSLELTLEPELESTVSLRTPVDIPLDARLPDLAQHIDLLDADLSDVTVPTVPVKKKPAAATSTPHKTDEIERNAARNVFAAKNTEKPKIPIKLVAGAAAGIILSIAGAVYFWQQLQPANSLHVSSQVSVATQTNQQTAALPAQSVPQPTLIPAVPATIPTPPQPIASTAPPTETKPLASSSLELPKPQTSTEAARLEKTERARLASNALSLNPTNQPETGSPIRFSTNRSQTNPILNRAYDALQADRLIDAQRDYAQVLRSDAKNSDALLGLATIAARQGQTDRAAALYLSALEADPTDVNAQAGLLSLKGQSDPAQSESRLKTLLVSQPDSATLNFVLGNLYARQHRWGDAQQAYFRAYAADADNPDILFNLAVSLDQLHQNKLAVQYYRMALDTAGTRDTAFNREQVENRLARLSALQTP